MFKNITLDGLYRLSPHLQEKQKEDFFPKVFAETQIAYMVKCLDRIVAEQLGFILRGVAR